MNGTINAIQSVLSILVMVSIGYILAYKHWIDEKASSLLARLVVNVSLPALMISNMTSTFTREKLMEAGLGIILPFVVILLSYFISLLVVRLFKIDESRRGVFCVMFAFSNTVFIGLPVNLALFGDESTMYVLFYYFANTTLFWTIGVYGISKDARKNNGSIFSVSTLKRILSPPLLGFFTAVILIMLDVTLPKFLLDSSKYIGNMTTPLSMLFIGSVIFSVYKSGGLKLEKGIGLLLSGRFIITPLIVFCLLWVLPDLPDMMKNVFVIQSALPSMTQTAILAENYGADHKYAALMVTVTTLASALFIPVYMYILG